MYVFSKYYKDDISAFIKKTVPKYSKYTILESEKKLKEKYDYIILLNTLANIKDVQNFIKKIKKNCTQNSRMVIIYFNFFWRPVLFLASTSGLRKKENKEPNWLTQKDIENLLRLEGLEEVKSEKRFL